MPDMYIAERNQDEARKRHASVRAQHSASVMSRRRSSSAMVAALVAMAGGIGWLVYSNGEATQRLAHRDVVYGMIQPNGETISSTHYEDVAPQAYQEQAIQNALWLYIKSRDCFGSESPIRQYYIAQAMSDATVGVQVKREFDLKNPMAPQHVYGEHGIAVQCDLVDPPDLIGSPLNHQYVFRFRRWEQGPGSYPAEQANAPFYSVTVTYRTGIYPDDPRRAWLDRTTFNAAGVQVTDYPGAKPTGVPSMLNSHPR